MTVALPVSEQYVLDVIEKQLRAEYPQLDLDFASFARYTGPPVMPAAERLMAGRSPIGLAHRKCRAEPSVFWFILRLAGLFLVGVLMAAGTIIAWSAG